MFLVLFTGKCGGVNLKEGELISGSLRYRIYHLVPFAVSSKEAFFGTTEDKKLFY